LHFKANTKTVITQDAANPDPIYFEVKNHSLKYLELRVFEDNGINLLYTSEYNDNGFYLLEPESIELYTSEFNDNGFSKNLNEKEKEIYNNNLKDILSK
jgi:hypothetical protein